MPKFEEKPLPRGIKLYSEDVTQTQVDVAAALSSKGIDGDNLKTPFIPWRLTFAPTVLRPETFVDKEAALPFLFTLIPPQELFDAGGQQAYNQAVLSLDEISFSFDTRQEPAAVEYNIDRLHGWLQAYADIEIVLIEKQQWHFNPQMQTHLPERVLFSRTFRNGIEFASMEFPTGQANLQIQLSPYKTYALQVSCPYLRQLWNEGGFDACLPSPVFSLKGKWTRLPNTEITVGPQNDNPELGNGPNRATSDQNDTVNITVPAGASNIDAAVLNTNLTALDNKLFEGIQGGYGPNSEMGRYGHTLETMGYDIIAVPLFNSSNIGGFRAASLGDYENINRGPYFTVAAPNFVYDRFILPVAFPMEVHHVYCSWSLISPLWEEVGPPPQTHIPGDLPATTSTRWQVGVSMGSGIKSDWARMQQIAALEYSVDPTHPTYYQTHLIDRYRVKEWGNVMSLGGPADPKWDVALLSVPLMTWDGATKGKGYYEQGVPIFVGRGNSWTAGVDITAPFPSIDLTRRSYSPPYDAANNPVYEAAFNAGVETRGGENFIEVAARIYDPNGLQNVVTEGGSGANAMLTGHGGLWVYLVVKRAGVESVERLR